MSGAEFRIVNVKLIRIAGILLLFIFFYDQCVCVLIRKHWAGKYALVVFATTAYAFTITVCVCVWAAMCAVGVRPHLCNDLRDVGS